MIARLRCWLLGHDWWYPRVVIGEGAEHLDSGYVCRRCGKTEAWYRHKR